MWTYILSDLNGVEIAEITNATGRALSLGLNRAATASFTIRADNPLAAELFADDKLLKVYEDTTLRFHGNVVSSELGSSGDGTTITANAANPAWKLAHRLLGLSKGGTTYTGDRAKTARKFISELNTSAVPYATNPHTGIKLLAESSYVAGAGNYVAGPYRPALSCINDLAHTINGFDWFISPLEGDETATAGSWTVPLIGTFEANNAFGTTRTNTVFEFEGDGQHNVRTINYIRDLNDLVNKAYHIPNDLETEAVLEASNGASLEHRGRFETTADAFGLTDTGLRTAWLEEVIRVKKNPRNVVTMTLDIDDGTGRVPALGTDYWLGDLVTARAKLPTGEQLFSGNVRVYGVEISIAESGTATITPTFLDEEGESI